MTFERAHTRPVLKPWGSHDLKPWSREVEQEAIGELAFDRAAAEAPQPSLLLKLLFTKQKLSIQVHPDDAFAQSMGMANGKTEAWYVLSAEEGAQVAVGLERPLTQPELRDAIKDGSIADLVKWRPASAGDLFFVPAGTIHAIGAGLVIAEIQQNSDTTFRLFDHGSDRDLHIDQALAVADLEPTKMAEIPVHLTVERMKLASCPFFVMERIDLPPDANWELQAERETWALVISGGATIGSIRAGVGDVFFAEAEKIAIKVGRHGLTVMLAYADSAPQPNLLRDLDGRAADLAVYDVPRLRINQERSVILPFPSKERRP